MILKYFKILEDHDSTNHALTEIEEKVLRLLAAVISVIKSKKIAMLLHDAFLITSISTMSLILFRSVQTCFSLSASNLLTSIFKVFKLVGGVVNLSISNLSGYERVATTRV